MLNGCHVLLLSLKRERILILHISRENSFSFYIISQERTHSTSSQERTHSHSNSFSFYIIPLKRELILFYIIFLKFLLPRLSSALNFSLARTQSTHSHSHSHSFVEESWSLSHTHSLALTLSCLCSHFLASLTHAQSTQFYGCGRNETLKTGACIRYPRLSG
mmetsp:Transcript_88591/g.129543  ORF Transcript_88591/g.129543 Transcript_88591/m.129543 type:complete len:162 (-) Transcript_88591:127-612(-)